MPYIVPEARLRLNAQIESLADTIVDAGELNYTLTRLCARFAKRPTLCYSNIALVTGILSNVSQEFYKRLAENYEKNKAEINGDILEYSES